MSSANQARRGLSALMNSTIGAKIGMAVSGVVLVGFVVQHMVFNLQLFLGPEALNSYAYGLKHLAGGAFVWGGRAFLLAMLVLHVSTAIRLKARNQAARPQPYAAGQRFLATSYAARFMLLTGVVVLLFLFAHYLHFTFGVIQPENFHVVDAQGRYDVWRMVVQGFRVPLVAIAYVLANVALAFHLSHSVTSMFETLGLRAGRYRGAIDMVGPGVALFVFAGNFAMPVAVLAGLVHL